MVFIMSCTYAISIKSHDELLQILVTRVLHEGPQGRAVYVSQDPLPGGSIINSWMTKHVSPEEYKHAWFYFIDDQPKANWEHACRYIFIDVETGGYQIQKGRTPPDSIDGMIKLYSDE
jgi:nitrous oxide reductase accessory protein NosL